MLFKVFYYIIFSITLIYTLYFLVTGVLGLIIKHKKVMKNGTKNNYFAILIPARNEEKVIGNLFDSLNKLNYSKDKYEVYVIPNNCTDKTSDIAKEHDVSLLECTIETKTKGDVLKFAFSKLKNNKKIDAYIIFDADNVVHPDFLTHMDKYLENGYRVAQGFRDAKNPGDNWLSGSYALFYLFQNIFFNRARMSLGGSPSINGTGFMIKKELIDKEGFDTYTLTEDIEFTGQCALNNEKIAFAEEAITYDEYPSSFVASWKQRKRWSSGMIECMKLYSPKLFVNFLRTGNIASLDMSLLYFGAVIQVLNFVNIVMIAMFEISGTKLHDILSNFLTSGWINLISSYLIMILIELFALLIKRKKPRTLVSGILFFVFFIFTWIPINIVCLLKKQTKWEEIKHNRNININDIVK